MTTKTPPHADAGAAKHTTGPWAIHELLTSRNGQSCSRHKAEFIPWFVVPADQGRRTIGASTNEEEDRTKYAHPIAKVDYHKYRSDEEVRANARLIAAAPELLEALKRLTGMIRDYHNVYQNHSASVMMRQQGFKLAEEAISKAEGGHDPDLARRPVSSGTRDR